MQIVKIFDPSATTSGSFNLVLPGNRGKMLIYNESSFNLQLTFANNDTTYIPAWWADLYHLKDMPSPTVNWSQQSQLASNGPPISQVVVVTYEENEKVSGTYPAALTRQTNIGNAVNTVGGGSSFIQNDANTAGTSIIESTVSGDSGSAVSLTNDGLLTIGTAAHPGRVSFDHAKITSDGIGNLTVLDLLASIISPTPSATTLNGGTNGTANHYQPLQGTIKMVIVMENAFRTGASNQDWALPVAFTTGAFFLAGVVNTFDFMSGGVAQSADIITALASGGGTAVGGTSIHADSFGSIFHPFDTIRHESGAGSNHSGVLIIIGV